MITKAVTSSARDPGPPELQLELPFGHGHAYIGETLFVHCSIYLKYGDFEFTVVTPTNATVVSLNATHLSYGIDSAYVDVRDRCFPRTNASFYMNLTSEHIKASMKCCWIGWDAFTRCTEKPMNAKYLRQAPIMSLEVLSYTLSLQLHSNFSITCSAFVGTNGQLIWILRSPSTTEEWKMGADGHIINEKSIHAWVTLSGKDTTIHVSVDRKLGPHIESTYVRNVTDNLEGATVACQTHSTEDAVLNTADMTVTGPVITGKFLIFAS
ncbi:hypothetical protein PoB_004166800 [Plakobranchus ocellatus]|uniref:Uncharacterized protein n=1 Tax=Plakobranchus ocellatus TaxID=259542 RepID=A0AAV4B8K4_9GAST|nr:hypothetical protein PoB_004166800 [Plakobranchus ocellatus]